MIFLIFFTLSKNIYLKNNEVYISKGENLKITLANNISDLKKTDYIIFKLYYRINKILFNSFIHYGYFEIEEKTTLYNFLGIISKPSNVRNKITIVEGWSQNDLNAELAKYFDDFKEIDYFEILADTYYFSKNSSFKDFYEKIKKFKKIYLNQKMENIFFHDYSVSDLLIIASLVEKEALGNHDKRLISSVIRNRLKKNMKLQIDASVIYALTNGEYNLNRQLLLKDLKIKHPFNTYTNWGLPPQPISYIGTKTIDIILENYKSDYLFYFFNDNLNQHIFSKNYEQHKLKLNEYRKKK